MAGELNASDHAQVVNGAVSDINVGKQNFQFAEKAKEVHVASLEDRSQVSNTSTTNNTYLSFPIRSRTISDDPAVRYLQNRSGVLGPNDPYEFDEPLQAFCGPEKSAWQRDVINNRWQQAFSFATRLNEAVSKFEQTLRSQPTIQHGQYSHAETWTQLKDIVFQEVKRARDYYKYGDRKHSNVGDIIRHVKRDLSKFIRWLDWEVPEGQHRICLCAYVKCILSATADGKRLNKSLLTSLETIMSLFSDSRDYLQLCRERRLTSAMMHQSAKIFEQIAALFATLLTHSTQSQPSPKGRDWTSSSLEHLRSSLKEVDCDARAKRQRRELGPRPPIENEPYKLQIVNNYLYFFKESPMLAYPEQMFPHNAAHRNMIIGRPQKRRRTSHAYDSTGESFEQASSRVYSILDALYFKVSFNIKDLDECVDSADLSSKQKRKLSALTREEVFQDWLKDETQSSALVLYGNMEQDELISPISYLAARIGKEYYRKDGFIVLSYLCCLHEDGDAAAILARMIGQLLSQAGPLLSPSTDVVPRNELKRLKKRDPDTLARIFADIIRDLRSSRVIVFCLIDSISIYETDERCRDTSSMFSTFDRLIKSMRGRRRDRQKDKIVFKLLISEGARSSVADRILEERELLDMDENEEASEDDFDGALSSDGEAEASETDNGESDFSESHT